MFETHQDYLTYCEVSEKKPVLTREIDVVKSKPNVLALSLNSGAHTFFMNSKKNKEVGKP